jgi:hypothetical protein
VVAVVVGDAGDGERGRLVLAGVGSGGSSIGGGGLVGRARTPISLRSQASPRCSFRRLSAMTSAVSGGEDRQSSTICWQASDGCSGLAICISASCAARVMFSGVKSGVGGWLMRGM